MTWSLPPALDRAWLLMGGWPRRSLAAVLLLWAAVLGLGGRSHAATAGAMMPIVVARAALGPGDVLTAADVSTARWPPDLLPNGAVTDPAALIGKAVGVPLWPGDPVTKNRLLDATISSALSPGQVAVTVELLDSAHLAILHPGARIDLYAGTSPSTTSGSGSTAVATDVPVLAVLSAPGDGGSAAGSGASTAIVIACDSAAASRVAMHSADPFVASLRPTT
jgi:pilus assembly protein CpaB